MRFRFYILYLFFTLLFLFYPGDSYFFNIFAYNRQLFLQKDVKFQLKPALIPYVASSQSPQVNGQGVYIAELSTFTPLYEKNPHEHLLPASTTKVITALVALDLYKPDDIITVKRSITEGQVMGLFVGERMTVENLLYGLLVYSGNDAAFAFADYTGFDKFIGLMNKKAQQLHMVDTVFKNPAGLDDFSQYTTPFDLALASRELLHNKLLSKIVSTKEITISDVDYKKFHRLTNVNELLGEVPGIGGLKTGFTENAGENLVSFYRKDDHDYLIVILKSTDRFGDTKNAVKWIDDNVQFTKL